MTKSPKVKVSAVSYLNTKPFLLGFALSGLLENIDLELDIPSKTAERFKSKEVELALIPVGILPQLSNYQIVSDYCIGANGAVDTVALFAQRPLEELDTILLDYHSCTSVRLIQVLCAQYWKKEVQFKAAQRGYETSIKDRVGGVIIGDRTIGLEKTFAYKYDLAAAWKAYTGLPFVFAVWVANKELSPLFIQQLNKSFELGLAHIDDVVDEYKSQYPASFDVKYYLTHHIQYQLDAPKKKALRYFVNWVQEQESITV